MQPRLLALKSAVPPHILNQTDVSVRAAALFESRRRDMARLRFIIGHMLLIKCSLSHPPILGEFFNSLGLNYLLVERLLRRLHLGRSSGELQIEVTGVNLR